MRDLDKAAKHCGQTRQAFVQATVLAEVAEVLERRRMKKQRLSHNTHASQQQEIDTSAPTIQTGATLAEMLRQKREAANEIVQIPQQQQQQGQVVVNVGGGSGGANGGDAIDRLAAYVTAGRDFEQAHRLRTAVGILQASASTDEERRILAARLDEAVATKTKQKTNSGEGLVRTARVAFDKIADLLR